MEILKLVTKKSDKFSRRLIASQGLQVFKETESGIRDDVLWVCGFGSDKLHGIPKPENSSLKGKDLAFLLSFSYC